MKTKTRQQTKKKEQRTFSRGSKKPVGHSLPHHIPRGKPIRTIVASRRNTKRRNVIVEKPKESLGRMQRRHRLELRELNTGFVKHRELIRRLKRGDRNSHSEAKEVQKQIQAAIETLKTKQLEEIQTLHSTHGSRAAPIRRPHSNVAGGRRHQSYEKLLSCVALSVQENENTMELPDEARSPEDTTSLSLPHTHTTGEFVNVRKLFQHLLLDES